MNSITPAVAAQPTGRLYHLDALRAFAMIFGVLVHACSVGDLGPYRIIPFLSDHFRMASFFLVSAMLSAAVLGKRPVGDFIRRRIVTILLPFFATLILLNPIAVALLMYWHNPAFGFHVIDAFRLSFATPSWVKGPVVWHLHLWFLLSLAAYTLIIPGLVAIIGRSRPMLERVIVHIPLIFRMLILALLVAMLGLFIRAVAQLAFPGILSIWPITATLRYLPYIIAGVMLFMLPSLRSAMEGFNPLLGVTGILALILEMQADRHLGGWAARIVEPGAKYVVTFALVQFLFFACFKLVKKNNPTLSLVIDSIFTVYLFHYLFIYVFAFLWQPVGLPKGIFLLLVAICSLGVGLAIHWALVSRIPLLKLLFNGVVKPRNATGRANPQTPSG